MSSKGNTEHTWIGHNLRRNRSYHGMGWRRGSRGTIIIAERRVLADVWTISLCRDAWLRRIVTEVSDAVMGRSWGRGIVKGWKRRMESHERVVVHVV